MYTNHNIRSRMKSLTAHVHLSQWHYLELIIIVGACAETSAETELVSWV